MFIFKIHLPAIFKSSVSSVASMIGPLSMIVTGMIIGNIDLKKIAIYKNIYFITFIKMLAFPFIMLVFLKYSKLSIVVPNGEIILLITFSVGVNVGFEKANFSYNWRDNYNNNILQQGIEPPFNGRFKDQNMGFIHSNGSAGEIIKINSDGSLIIKDIDNTEKTVVINNLTTIRMFNQNIKIEDLGVRQNVVIIGEPNSSGEIEARLIRVMPEPLNK